MATKPYAATSTYIRKMSKYCAGCRFDPDKTGGRVPVQLPVLGLHRPTRGAVRAESADARDRWRLVETDGIEQGYGSVNPQRSFSMSTSQHIIDESQPSARVALSAPRTLGATCARGIGGRSCVAGNAASLRRRPMRRAQFA
jgi:hypothetical protein